MASEKLLEKIAEITAKLDTLQKLAKTPPVLPEGWKLAQVGSTDWTALKYNDYLPPERSWTVVPFSFPDTVTVLGQRDGNIVETADGRKWSISSWGETHEEAIYAHLQNPGEWMN